MPFIPKDDYWIRGFDFPRLQLLFILLLAAILGGYVLDFQDQYWPILWLVLIAVAAVYQAYRILPYTQFWSKTSRDALQRGNGDCSIKILVSNVLQTNQDSAPLIKLIKARKPDLFLTLESNARWERELDAELGSEYPHKIAIPQENLYGMHLYSKLEFLHEDITYRIKDDIPGINTAVRLPCGREVNLYFVHPMPPSPTEAYASTGRDGELAKVGLKIKEVGGSSIVAGDLNDVAWSHSTRLFKRLSGLVDPRVGRGLYATFHANYWLARWPLDHVFHSTDFAVVQLERLPSIGSDHFPILTALNYEPVPGEAIETETSDDDLNEAIKTMQKASAGKEDTIEYAAKQLLGTPCK